MTNAPLPHPPLAPARDVVEDEQLDPELLELPDPPRRERSVTLAVLVLTALASVAMVFALRHDAAYAFADAHARDVGDLATAPASIFAQNAFVHGRVMVGAAHAIRYERPLVSDSFRLMPVAGRENVWVEVRVPAGSESARWVPPSEVSGRLVHFDASGPKHRGLAAAVHDVTGADVPVDAWLLVDGDAPPSSRWAVMLVALFAAFAAWNVAVTAKLLRKVR